MRESRTFECHNNTDGLYWKLESKEKEWLTLCYSTVEKYWNIEYAQRIEVVLTDRKVTESHELTFHHYRGGGNFVQISNQWVAITYPQEYIIEKFLFKHKRCFMYINILFN